MKRTAFVIAIVLLSLILSACGQASPTPQATAIPTVLADTSIISEGRLEPVRFTEIALSASGLVSEVLATEGQQVEAGQVIARLESSEVKTLEAAQATASQQLTAAYQAVRDAQFKLDNFDVPTDFKGITHSQDVETTMEKLSC